MHSGWSNFVHPRLCSQHSGLCTRFAVLDDTGLPTHKPLTVHLSLEAFCRRALRPQRPLAFPCPRPRHTMGPDRRGLAHRPPRPQRPRHRHHMVSLLLRHRSLPHRPPRPAPRPPAPTLPRPRRLQTAQPLLVHLATFLNCMERLSKWPPALSQAWIALIPKGSSLSPLDHRPISVTSAGRHPSSPRG